MSHDHPITAGRGLKRVVTKRAMSTEVVEIQWVLPDNTLYWERHTCPPVATREARIAERTGMAGVDERELG